jgi:hypothetical protein
VNDVSLFARIVTLHSAENMDEIPSEFSLHKLGSGAL